MKTTKMRPTQHFILITVIFLLILFILGNFLNSKPSFKNNDQALSYLFVNTDKYKEFSVGKDSLINICTGVNYAPIWHRERLYVELILLKDNSKISFIAEKAGGDLGWFRFNEDDERGKLYLNSFSKKDVELLKIAYKAFKK